MDKKKFKLKGPTGMVYSRRAVIVCPSSLVGNWGAEIKKWLGDLLVPQLFGDSKKGRAKLSAFEKGEKPVLVISYDQMKIFQNDIAKCHGIGEISRKIQGKIWLFATKDTS